MTEVRLLMRVLGHQVKVETLDKGSEDWLAANEIAFRAAIEAFWQEVKARPIRLNVTDDVSALRAEFAYHISKAIPDVRFSVHATMVFYETIQTERDVL